VIRWEGRLLDALVGGCEGFPTLNELQRPQTDGCRVKAKPEELFLDKSEDGDYDTPEQRNGGCERL